LKNLPEAVWEKIGFKPPNPRPSTGFTSHHGADSLSTMSRRASTRAHSSQRSLSGSMVSWYRISNTLRAWARRWMYSHFLFKILHVLDPLVFDRVRQTAENVVAILHTPGYYRSLLGAWRDMTLPWLSRTDPGVGCGERSLRISSKFRLNTLKPIIYLYVEATMPQVQSKTFTDQQAGRAPSRPSATSKDRRVGLRVPRRACDGRHRLSGRG
jgi:hypothetical protein